MPRRHNLVVGQKFGLLTVIAAVDQHLNRSRFAAHCECGNDCVVAGTRLSTGKTRSCGCLRGWGSATHGRSRKKGGGIYSIWKGMNRRCNNPKNPAYKNYGGRGIAICERWRSFENFLADMGEQPHGMQIERRDNDGNYEPGNCYWATRIEQARNRRSNVAITWQGETRCLREWTDRLGMNYYAVRQRLKNGWTTERALTEPSRGKPK